MTEHDGRVLKSLLVVGTLAILELMAGIGMISVGRSPEFAILWCSVLGIPSLVITSWYIGKGFGK